MKHEREIKDLEGYSGEYTSPTPARLVDQKIVHYMAQVVVAEMKDGNVLEMGVGDQIWTPLVLERFGATTVVDASAPLLDALARFKGQGEIEKHCSLFEEFNPEKKFDNILCTFVLEHVDDPAQTLRRAAGWLKPDGEIHMIVPHAMSLHRRLAVVMGLQEHVGELGDSDRLVGHRRCVSYPEMDRIVLDAGLKIARRSGLGVKLVPNSLMQDYSDELLKGLVLLGTELPIEYSASIYYRITA